MATPLRCRPDSLAELIDRVTDAARTCTRLDIRGGGSKAQIGAPVNDVAILDMSGFADVIDYDPEELVLTIGAGTPLAVIEALLANESQMLAFEPFDFGPIFGRPPGASTIGGVVAAGMAGSRRVSSGSVRDHLLGIEAVSGRGERFVAGAKVVKNVTGYDLPKLMCGSWGRLVALTQVTFKVLPKGRTRATRMLEGLDARQAAAVMARALGSQSEASAAAHLPTPLRGGTSLTALRVEGFGPSVAARCGMLEKILCGFGAVHTPSQAQADAFWADLRTLAPLADGRPLWRINVPPSAGPVVVETLAPLGARWLFDWAGGLIWLTFDGDAAMARATAEAAGGHAMLVRGPDALRARVPALHPPAPGVAALEERVRRAFDPCAVFETGRFMIKPEPGQRDAD